MLPNVEQNPHETRFDQPVLCILKEGNNLISLHRRKALQKLIVRFARLQIIEQCLDRHDAAMIASSYRQREVS
jgi:hypothetical protein